MTSDLHTRRAELLVRMNKSRAEAEELASQADPDAQRRVLRELARESDDPAVDQRYRAVREGSGTLGQAIRDPAVQRALIARLRREFRAD